MIIFEWGYLLSLLDQLSNLALNSLVVETCESASVLIGRSNFRPNRTLQACALLLSKV